MHAETPPGGQHYCSQWQQVIGKAQERFLKATALVHYILSHRHENVSHQSSVGIYSVRGSMLDM